MNGLNAVKGNAGYGGDVRGTGKRGLSCETIFGERRNAPSLPVSHKVRWRQDKIHQGYGAEYMVWNFYKSARFSERSRSFATMSPVNPQ